MPSKYPLLLVASLVLLLQLLMSSPCWSAPHLLLKDRIQNGGYIIQKDGKVIESLHEEKLFIPASTIKLLTSYTVLKTLGENYRFKTRFYIDKNSVLYVKGGGDPVLTSESLLEAVRTMKSHGLLKISEYVLDDSSFKLESSRTPGSENSTNPYDVANGALAVNFNSIAIRKHANGTVSSGEPQTPVTQLAREIGRQLPVGMHRVNPEAFQLRGNTPSHLRYSGELLHELFAQEGVDSTQQLRTGKVPSTAKLLYTHYSTQTVREIVRSCLHFSSNFIANQLILVAAAERYGYPASWQKTRKLMEATAFNELQIPDGQIHIEEGSGLSRQTVATPLALLRILEGFKQYRSLLPIKFDAQVKSGTMKSIYCYAGYIESRQGPVLFALLLNQNKNTRDQLLRSLVRKIDTEMISSQQHKRVFGKQHAYTTFN